MKKVHVRFQDLETEIATTMRTAAQKAALAANGKPQTREAVLFGFRPIHQMMRSAITSVNSRLLLQSNSFATERGLIHKEEEQARLERVIRSGEDRAVTLSGYAKADTGAVRRILQSALLVLLCLGDSIFNESGLEHLLKLNFITSQVVAIVFSAILAFLAHEAVPKYVRAPHGSYPKRMATVMLSAITVFMLLALVRADGLPTDMMGLVQVLTFTLLSASAYFAATLLGIRLFDSKSTRASDQEAQAAKDLKEVRAEVQRAKAALEGLDANTKEQAVYAAELAEYGESLKQGIISDAHAVFLEYLKMVYNNRDAGTDVSIFDFPEYPEPLETEPKQSANKTGGMASVIILTAALGLLFSCTPKDDQGAVAVTVLVDTSTPIREGYPEASDIISFTGLNTDMWQGEIRISISTISDVDFAPSYTHVLEGAERWNSNLDNRKDSVARFEERIEQSLLQVRPPDDVELGHSIIYRTIARHAMELCKLPYKRRYLLVWSDLMENSGNITFYGKPGRTLLKQPERLEKRFAEQVPLGDLSGLTIYFVHRPNEKSNADFVAASGFFQDLFSRHNAVTRVSATLPNP